MVNLRQPNITPQVIRMFLNRIKLSGELPEVLNVHTDIIFKLPHQWQLIVETSKLQDLPVWFRPYAIWPTYCVNLFTPFGNDTILLQTKILVKHELVEVSLDRWFIDSPMAYTDFAQDLLMCKSTGFTIPQLVTQEE